MYLLINIKWNIGILQSIVRLKNNRDNIYFEQSGAGNFFCKNNLKLYTGVSKSGNRGAFLVATKFFQVSYNFSMILIKFFKIPWYFQVFQVEWEPCYLNPNEMGNLCHKWRVISPNLCVINLYFTRPSILKSELFLLTFIFLWFLF